MSRTVSASYSVVYDTLAEYNEGVTNIANFESDPENPTLTNKNLDENNLTISYDVTEVI